MANKSPIQNRDFILFGMRIVGEFGAVIALPIIIFILIGQWADERFISGYVFTVLAFVISGILSARILVKKARKYGKEYQELINKKDQNT